MFIPVGTEEYPRRRGFPVVNAAIVGLNTLVFVIELYILTTGGERGLDLFVTSFGVVPASIVSGDSILIPFYLTPFTSMFVHAGLAHIGSNMIFLAAFGDNLEDRLGGGRYVLFYLLSGLVATFAHIWVDPNSQIPAVGASGAIAGVLSGYLILFPKGLVRMFLFWGPFLRISRVPAIFFVGFWFVTQLFSGIASLGVRTAATGGVAYWAHIGGFVAGLLLMLIFKQSMRPYEARSI